MRGSLAQEAPAPEKWGGFQSNPSLSPEETKAEPKPLSTHPATHPEQSSEGGRQGLSSRSQSSRDKAREGHRRLPEEAVLALGWEGCFQPLLGLGFAMGKQGTCPV